MAGDVDEGRFKLHQRFYAVVQPADVAALQRWHQLEAGKGPLAVIQDFNDFHIVFVSIIVMLLWRVLLRNVFGQQLAALVDGDAAAIAVVFQLRLVDATYGEVAGVGMEDEESADGC